MTDEERDMLAQMQTDIAQTQEAVAEMQQSVDNMNGVLRLLLEDDTTTGRQALLPWAFDYRKRLDTAGLMGRWIIRIAAGLIALIAVVNGFFNNMMELLSNLAELARSFLGNGRT